MGSGLLLGYIVKTDAQIQCTVTQVPHFIITGHAISQRKASTVTRPSVQSEHLAPTLLLLTKILRQPPANLGQGGAHDFAKVALQEVLAYAIACMYEDRKTCLILGIQRNHARLVRSHNSLTRLDHARACLAL